MDDISENITYKTEEIIESVKLLQLILISLRKIGDYSIDSEEFDIKGEIYKFLVDADVLEKLAEIRMTLESEFEEFPRSGDKSFLEVMTESLVYWSPK